MKYTPRERHKVNIQLNKQYKLFHPLPQGLMALDGVQLWNDFFGYLRKLGILFFGFMDAIDRIGCNAALLCMLTCAYSVQLTKGSINCETTAIRTINIFGRTSIEMVAPTDPTDSIPSDNQQISGITREYDWTLPTDAELE